MNEDTNEFDDDAGHKGEEKAAQAMQIYEDVVSRQQSSSKQNKRFLLKLCILLVLLMLLLAGLFWLLRPSAKGSEHPNEFPLGSTPDTPHDNSTNPGTNPDTPNQNSTNQNPPSKSNNTTQSNQTSPHTPPTNSNSTNPKRPFPDPDIPNPTSLDGKPPNQIYPTILNMVPHTHLDLGWLQTEQGYYSQTVKAIIDSSIAYLKANPEAKLTFSDIGFLYMWIKENPNRLEEVRKVVDSGQLYLANGGYVMSDLATPTFDDLLTNFQFGRKYLHEKGLQQPQTIWSTDQFGLGKSINKIARDLGYSEHVTNRFSTEVLEDLRKKSDLLFKISPWKLKLNTSFFAGAIKPSQTHQRHTKDYDDPSISIILLGMTSP